MKTQFGNLGAGIGQYINDKIINSENISAIAENQIQIGDTVYILNIEYTDIYMEDGSVLDGQLNAAAFSPDGKVLVLGGSFSGYAKIYSVDGINLTYVDDIYADNEKSSIFGDVDTLTFSPNGKLLFVGGQIRNRAKIYSVDGTNFTFISDVYADNNNTILDGYYVNCSDFSKNGDALVLGGTFTGGAKIYSVNDTTITYIDDIYTDNNGSETRNDVDAIKFTPDGKYLLVAGGDYGRDLLLYEVNGTSLTFLKKISDIDSDKVYDIQFSADGSLMAVGLGASPYVRLFSVNGENFSLIASIEDISDRVHTLTFLLDDQILAVGGFSPRAGKLYSIDGNNFTYIEDIYLDENQTAIQSDVQTLLSFPDGKNLLLGLYYTESSFGKIYPINSSGIIYKNSFATLVSEGKFTSLPYGAKMGFSVSGAEIGEAANVKTIGRIAVNYNLDEEIATQDELIAQIDAALDGKAKPQ